MKNKTRSKEKKRRKEGRIREREEERKRKERWEILFRDFRRLPPHPSSPPFPSPLLPTSLSLLLFFLLHTFAKRGWPGRFPPGHRGGIPRRKLCAFLSLACSKYNSSN
jgi:hypothetical protein